MIQPQKRIDIRPALELLVIRILEVKEKLIEHNRRPHSVLVHLDDILMDLKLDPKVLEVPVPRWLRDNAQTDEHLKLLNLEEKSEGKKKKKKKRKKKKKEKKVKDKENEEHKLPCTIAEKEAWYDKIIKDNNIQEEEEVVEPFAYEMDIVMAIRLIQKNERGRQWRQRLLKIISIRRKALKDAEMKKRIKEGLEMASDTEKDNRATLLVQKRLKGLIARAKVNKMRQEELYFLGMAERPKTLEELKNSTSEKVKDIEASRKRRQEEIYKDYKNSITKIKDEIKANEEFDMRDQMLDERMLWIIDYRRDHGGKLPKGVPEFYKRLNVEKPKTEEQLALEEAMKAAKKGKKGEKKAAKKAGKKKGEKKVAKKEYLWTGPTTDAVIQLQGETEKYIKTWENKDESTSASNYDVELIKSQVRPKVEKEIEVEVDKLIEIELTNLELQEGKKKKKKKKKKKAKKKKGKKKAKKLPAALKLIAKKSTYELLNELFVLGIAKKLTKEYRVSDFVGDYNYIGSIEDMTKPVADTSLAQIRSMVTEWGILPLGSKAIHENVTRNYGGIKSMLFIGPQGSGKTMMTKTIASETCSLFLDVSPAVIENTYPDKKGEDKLVATVMRVAKELQPAVIYIDECEMVFPSKKKGKKKKKGAKKGKGASRIKKQLVKLKKVYLKKNDQVLIVGCTNTVDEMSAIDTPKFFDVHISFPYPDSLNRKNMWETMIKRYGGILDNSFPISTLTHITEGYTTGSIKLACEKVLTEQRRKAVRLNI
jgi:ATP-dependent 26S proteasome regulatory subunit